MNKILRREMVVFDTFINFGAFDPTMLERLERDV